MHMRCVLQARFSCSWRRESGQSGHTPHTHTHTRTLSHTYTHTLPAKQQLLNVTSEPSTAPALALSYQHGMQFSKLSIFYANSHTFQDAALSSTTAAAAAAARLAPMPICPTPRQGADRRRIKRLYAKRKNYLHFSKGDSSRLLDILCPAELEILTSIFKNCYLALFTNC